MIAYNMSNITLVELEIANKVDLNEFKSFLSLNPQIIEKNIRKFEIPGSI